MKCQVDMKRGWNNVKRSEIQRNMIVSASQAEGRGFESPFPLQNKIKGFGRKA